MKAIVLTYDKYHVFTDHMIHAYQKKWPSNPFTFRIPYQKDKDSLVEKYGDKVEMIQTNKSIISTINKLINDLDDNEWIYWCMDDRYPIHLEYKKITQIYNWLKTIEDELISALLFVNSRQGQKPINLQYFKDSLKDDFGNLYRRRKTYKMIWIHQFMRVKVLKTLFNLFPQDLKNAKEMDYYIFKNDVSVDQRLYSCSKNLGVFGESTSRGEITKNCHQSFLENGLEIPEGFKISSKVIEFGHATSLSEDLIFWTKNILRLIIKKK